LVDEYPRNVCIDHPLCTHFALHGWQCGALAVPPNLMKRVKHDADLKIEFAVAEAILGDGQCWGIAKRTKERCKSIGIDPSGGQFWCNNHRTQAPVLAVPVAAPLEEEVDEVDEYELLVEGCQPTVPLPLERLDDDTRR
jgi:hypothetical protein